jgi:hypothetical protein
MTELTAAGRLGGPRPLPEWFTTAAHVGRRADKRGMATWLPAGAAHARHVGSRTTACGVVATNWPMLFDVRFTALVPHVCRACVEEVQGAAPIDVF